MAGDSHFKRIAESIAASGEFLVDRVPIFGQDIRVLRCFSLFLAVSHFGPFWFALEVVLLRSPVRIARLMMELGQEGNIVGAVRVPEMCQARTGSVCHKMTSTC